MVTIIIILNLIGGFVFYNLSQKIKTPEKGLFFKLIYKNQKSYRAVGVMLFCIALLLSILFFGFVSGLLFWLLLLSIILCFIIVLVPLYVVNYKCLGVFVVLCLIVEILVK